MATGTQTPSSNPAPVTACPCCEYPLEGLEVALCPECGVDVRAEFERRGAPKRVWPIVVVWSLSLLGWGWGALAMQGLYAHYTGSAIGLDPAWMLIHLAAVVSAFGLITTLVFRRTLRTALTGCYWALAAPGFLLLVVFAVILVLILAG